VNGNWIFELAHTQVFREKGELYEKHWNFLEILEIPGEVRENVPLHMNFMA